MVDRALEIGPGSIRVGRFIGRLGVVPMPAVGGGLGLVDRVVRRHVAKLEKVGWCERVSAVRGEGMLLWMTLTGLDGVGLGELPAPRAPNPFSPQTLHSSRVAWASADIEHAGHQWIAIREVALAPDGWSAEIANQRGGYSRRLPDLVFWPARDRRRQVAVVVVQGLPNPRRERAALQGVRRFPFGDPEPERSWNAVHHLRERVSESDARACPQPRSAHAPARSSHARCAPPAAGDPGTRSRR